MRIKNILSLLMANLRTVFADLIFRSVIFLILIGIGASFVVPVFSDIWKSPEAKSLFALLKTTIGDFFNGSSDIALHAQQIPEVWANVLKMLASHVVSISFASVGIILLFVAFMFFNGMANYASGVVIDSYMSSLTKIGYFKAILHDFSKGFWYQFITAVINVVWTVLLLAVCIATLYFTVSFLSIFALTLSVIIFCLGKALLNTVLSNFMPSIVTGKNTVGKAFKNTFTLLKGHFGVLFIQYLVFALVGMYINVSFGICTFGAGLIFTLPACCVCGACVRLVNYYFLTKRKYYINYDNIIVPVELRGDDEKFLNGIEL